MDKACSIAIFRIFQETLTNVARHADASEVKVDIKRIYSYYEMSISDNGKGITDEEIFDPRSFGLTGMRERVHYLRGDIRIIGSENKGTTGMIRIPINEQEIE